MRSHRVFMKTGPGFRQVMYVFILILCLSVATHLLTRNRSSISRFQRKSDTNTSLHIRYTLQEVRMKGEYKRRLPSAMIIGCMKGGTGTLKEFLSLHPDVAMPEGKEETHFFSSYYHAGLSWYLKQMPFSYPHQVTMEKSNYFANQRVNPGNIKKAVGDKVKFIILVREPVDRIVSHFSMTKIRHKLTKALESFVFDSKSGEVMPDSIFIRRSAYYQSMVEWLKYFPREQFLILDSSEFVKNPLPLLQRIETFLKISHIFTDDIFYFDENKGFYCYVKEDHKECMPSGKGRTHITVNPATIRKLQDYFKPLNDKFVKLVNESFLWNTY